MARKSRRDHKGDEQLAWVADLFESAGIDWWVESGTLLSMTRSGGITDYDDDIDLATWASEIDALEDLLGAFEDRDYHVQRRSYHGHVYKYQFLPAEGEDHRSEEKRRLIDLMVFRRTESHAWTAQARLSRNSPVPGLSTALEYATPIAERFARTTPGAMEMTEFPKRGLLDLVTLWLPLEYVDDPEYDDELGVNVPASLDEYLTFRYDDWRTPVEEWSLSDDGAVREVEPAELVL